MTSSQETLYIGHSTKTNGAPSPPHETRVSPLLRRIHGWSWQAFPIGMGTGAVFVCLSDVEQTPGHPLTIIGTVFFYLNLFLFCLNLSTLLLQLILYPKHARELITDTSRDIFVPLMVLSFATIVIGLVIYGVPSGPITPTTICCLFWVYVALSLVVCLPVLMIWYNEPHDLNKCSPAWAFLIFPIMLTGVVAYNVLKKMDPSDPRALGMLLAGYIFQGLGFFMTLFYICIYILRIMMTGFMDGAQASGAFVACGPPGFTAIALINLGDHAREILPAQNILFPDSGEVWYAASVVCALFLFGLAVFFFVFGALPYWFKFDKHLNEILACKQLLTEQGCELIILYSFMIGWALTFPNVGWILTLRKIGDIFHLRAFTVWHTVMVIYMCTTWTILFGFTAIAFCKGKIFNASAQDVARDSEEGIVHIHYTEKPSSLKNQHVDVSISTVDAAEDSSMRDPSQMV